MKELSLHILDIVQNSIEAKATLIEISILENTQHDTLAIIVKDNGCGMSKEFLDKVTSPFITTRTTRKVGLGISLFKAAAEGCNGSFFIDSEPGIGTIIEAKFKRSHIDRAPIGNMADTFIVMILSNPEADYSYFHSINDKEFIIDTRKLKDVLGQEVAIQNLDVLDWIKGHIQEGVKDISI